MMIQSRVKNDPITAPVLGVHAAQPLASRDAISRIFPKVDYHEIPGRRTSFILER